MHNRYRHVIHPTKRLFMLVYSVPWCCTMCDVLKGHYHFKSNFPTLFPAPMPMAKGHISVFRLEGPTGKGGGGVSLHSQMLCLPIEGVADKVLRALRIF